MPSFTAEVSLYRSRQTYHSASIHNEAIGHAAHVRSFIPQITIGPWGPTGGTGPTFPWLLCDFGCKLALWVCQALCPGCDVCYDLWDACTITFDCALI